MFRPLGTARRPRIAAGAGASHPIEAFKPLFLEDPRRSDKIERRDEILRTFKMTVIKRDPDEVGPKARKEGGIHVLEERLKDTKSVTRGVEPSTRNT